MLSGFAAFLLSEEKLANVSRHQATAKAWLRGGGRRGAESTSNCSIFSVRRRDVSYGRRYWSMRYGFCLQIVVGCIGAQTGRISSHDPMARIGLCSWAPMMWALSWRPF